MYKELANVLASLLQNLVCNYNNVLCSLQVLSGLLAIWQVSYFFYASDVPGIIKIF